MGLFGKKKYVKNVTRNNVFLKDYAIKVNALINFAQGHDQVIKVLEALKDDFQYSVPTNHPEAKKLEKKIESDYQSLSAMMAESAWEESEVIRLINIIRQSIIELTSKRG